MKYLEILICIAILCLCLCACGAPEIWLSADSTPASTPQSTPVPTPESTPIPHSTPVPTDPQHTHEYVQTVYGPTCSKDGYTEYRCACGDNYADDKISASGHNFGEWYTTKAPTPVETGTSERKCAVCGETETKTMGKLETNHTHEYTENITRVSTCVNMGVKTFRCSCGDMYTEDIPKLAHTYTEKTIAPTCTNDGYTKYTCKCGDSYTDNKIAATGHSYIDTVAAPTCTEDGYTSHKCSVCSDFYKDNIVKAAGHNYVENVVAATCKNEGYTTHTCSNCKKSYTDNHTPVSDHDYKKSVVEPTCTENGYTLFKCDMCGDSKKTNIKSAYGHEYTTTKSTPSCTTDGYTLYSCRYCDNSYKENVVKATGHQNLKTIEKPAQCVYSGSVRVVCKDCNETISEQVLAAPATSHACQMMIVADAVKDRSNKGVYDYLEWANYKDWRAPACTQCDYIDVDAMEFIYTDYEAAVIMLGYVNNLRASVYGTHDYDLKLSTTLVSLASIRSKELVTNYSHNSNSVNTYAGENIVNGGPNIYDQFVSWKNSSGHYKNMIDKDYTEFGYALYKTDGKATKLVYGTQLFWTPSGKQCYFDQ